MILFDAENRVLKQTLLAEFGYALGTSSQLGELPLGTDKSDRFTWSGRADQSKAGETDIHLLEFDDVRYHLQARHAIPSSHMSKQNLNLTYA